MCPLSARTTPNKVLFHTDLQVRWFENSVMIYGLVLSSSAVQGCKDRFLSHWTLVSFSLVIYLPLSACKIRNKSNFKSRFSYPPIKCKKRTRSLLILALRLFVRKIRNLGGFKEKLRGILSHILTG